MVTISAIAVPKIGSAPIFYPIIRHIPVSKLRSWDMFKEINRSLRGLDITVVDRYSVVWSVD